MNLLTRFTVDMSALERAFSRAQGLARGYAQEADFQFKHASWSVNRFGTALGEANQKASQFRSGMMGLGVTLGAVGAAMTAMTALMTREAIKQESAFAGIKKTVDETVENFGRLHANLREMSNRRPVEFSDLARIGELAGQLGVRGVDNLTKFIDVISRLAVSTALTTEAAATSFARIANVMQEPISNVDRMGAAVVELGNKFATTEPEIVTFAERIAGAGKISKLTTADVLAIGAAMSSVGIEAEAGGTAVNKMLIAITQAVASGGDKLEQFSRLAGETTESFTKLFQTKPIEAFTRVVEGLGKAGQGAFSFIDEIVGGEARFTRAFLSLANATDLLRTAVTKSNDAWRENKALIEESEKRFKTTESAILTMWSATKNLAASFGDTLLPLIGATARALTDLVVGFQKLSDPVKMFAALLGIGVAGTLTLTGGFALFLSMVPSVVAGFNLIGASALLLMGKIGLIAVALAAIGVAIHHVYTQTNVGEHSPTALLEQRRATLLKGAEMRSGGILAAPGERAKLTESAQRELDMINTILGQRTLSELSREEETDAMTRSALRRKNVDEMMFGTVSKEQQSDYNKLVREMQYLQMSPAQAEIAKFRDSLMDRAKDAGSLRPAFEAQIPKLMAYKQALADVDAQWRQMTLDHDQLKQKFQELEDQGLLADGDKNPLSFFNMLAQNAHVDILGVGDALDPVIEKFYGWEKPLTLLSTPEGPMAGLSDRAQALKNDVEELGENLALLRNRLTQSRDDNERDRIALDRFGTAYADLSPEIQNLINKYIGLDRARKDVTKDTERLNAVEEQHHEIVKQGLGALITQDELLKATKLREYEAALQQVVSTKEALVTKDERLIETQLKLNELVAREQGNVWDFIIAKMQQAAGVGVSIWKTMADAATSAVNFMRDTLSNVLFNWFTGQAVSMRDLFRSVMQSMARAVADFIATQAVQQLLGFLVSGFGGLLGGGGVGGAAAGAAANAAGGTLLSGSNIAQGSLGLGSNAASQLGYGNLLSAIAPALFAGITGYGAISGNSNMTSIGASGQILYNAAAIGKSLYGSYLGPTSAFVSDTGMLTGTLSPGLSNFNYGNIFSGANIASGLGIVGGLVALIGAQTGNQKVVNAGSLLSAGSLGLTAGLGIAGASAAGAGAAAGGAAAAGATAGVAGAAVAAVPYLAAIVLAALSIYNATQVTGGKFNNLSEGQRIGTRVGAYASPTGLLLGPANLLIPKEYSAYIDPIGSYIGGLIGSLFGKPDVPHKVREARETREVYKSVNETLAQITQMKDMNALYGLLWDRRFNAGRGPSLTSTFVGDTDISSLSTQEAIQRMLANPESITASVNAGVNPALLVEANTALTEQIRSQVKFFNEQIAAVRKVYEQLGEAARNMRDSLGSLIDSLNDSPDALENAKDSLHKLFEGLDTQIDTFHDNLLKETDPGRMLEMAQQFNQMVQERYLTELAAVKDIVGVWLDAKNAVDQTLKVLRNSTLAPVNPGARYTQASSGFASAFSSFLASSTPTTAGAVSEAANLLLEAGQQVFARPSTDWQNLFTDVTDKLQIVSDTLGGKISEVTDGMTFEEFMKKKQEEMVSALETLHADLGQVVALAERGVSVEEAFAIVRDAELVIAEMERQTAMEGTNRIVGAVNATTAAVNGLRPLGTNNIGQVGPLGPDYPWPYQPTTYYPPYPQGGATGISYVPKDDLYYLHREEAVLDRTEAEAWREGQQSGGVNIIFEPGSVIVNGTSDDDAEEFIEKILDRVRHDARFGEIGSVIRGRRG